MVKKILILGVGNTLLSDEGFGPAAIYYLQEHYRWPENVTLVDGATRGLMLMSELMDCDLAIVLDIVLGGGTPGTTYLLEESDMGKSLSFRHSMHQTGLEDVLISCDLAGHRPEAVVIGFEPFDYATVSERISPAAEKELPQFCEKVVRHLAENDITHAERIDRN